MVCRRLFALTLAALLLVVACSADFQRKPLFDFWCAPGEYHSCTCPWEDAASTHRWGETHCTESMHLGPCQCDGGIGGPHGLGPDATADAR